MKTDPTKSVSKLRDSTYESDGGFGEKLACGVLFLGLPSLAAIVIVISLAQTGVNLLSIEKGMVWLSVPWFSLCYALCRMAHGTMIYVADETQNPPPPPLSREG